MYDWRGGRVHYCEGIMNECRSSDTLGSMVVKFNLIGGWLINGSAVCIFREYAVEFMR